MNVAWQRETTTATVDVSDYYLLCLLSPNLQQKALCCWRLNDWCKGTSQFLCWNNKCFEPALLCIVQDTAGWSRLCSFLFNTYAKRLAEYRCSYSALITALTKHHMWSQLLLFRRVGMVYLKWIATDHLTKYLMLWQNCHCPNTSANFYFVLVAQPRLCLLLKAVCFVFNWQRA